jgi:hypothetical protein
VEDGRVESPTVSAEEWDRRLKMAGFGGTETVVYDSRLPYFTYANIIARPTTTTIGNTGRLTLLTSNQHLDDFATITKRTLEDAGYQINVCVWGAELPSDEDVVSLVDINSISPILSDENPETLTTFLDYIGDAATSTVLWLTRPAQTTCSDPRHGLILGMARTLRAKLGMHFAALELDRLDGDAVSTHDDCSSNFSTPPIIDLVTLSLSWL